MASIIEQKNNSRCALGSRMMYPHRQGYRTVSHPPVTGDCTNCYLTNSRMCDKCAYHRYEIKTHEMSWEEFKAKVDPLILLKYCTKIPDSYVEFCDLYDMSYDLPALIGSTSSDGEEYLGLEDSGDSESKGLE